MKTVNKANFICSFKEIQNFPFNTQICSFKIFVSGTDNLASRLNMIETIRDVTEESRGQRTVNKLNVIGRLNYQD